MMSHFDEESLVKLTGAISTESEAEEVIELLNAIQYATRRLREIKETADESIVEWIDRNGDLEIGDTRYYVGESKSYKPKSVRETAEVLIDHVGGDLDGFCEFLGSYPFKYGEVRNRLGQTRFRELFKENVSVNVKTGKPRRQVKRAFPRPVE